jgi:ABC-type multidrug transport system fused ATPase/permease subunit
MILGAVAELATLGAVLPFLALLADPTVASKYPLLQKMFFALGWSSQKNIVLPATIFFGVIALSAAAVRMFLLWYSTRFTFGVGVDLCKEVYRRTLYQPYSFHVSRNTSEIIAGLTKVDNIVFYLINPLAQGVVAALISIALIGALIHIDPITAATAGVGFTLIYILVTFSGRRRLHQNSEVIAAAETQRVQAIQEGLGAIRDVLIDGAQGVYITRYWHTSASQALARSAIAFTGGAPRYLIESLGMVLIAGLACWLSAQKGGLTAAIPVLGALALGAQKLMPQMQQMYSSWVTVSGSRASLGDVIAFLEQPIPEEYLKPPATDPVRFEREIALCDVSFRYRRDAPEVIRRLNLKIRRGDRVGFIGKTGSGKSTVIDLIMGLLEPTAGGIEIDGRRISSANRRTWQGHIAHVPQSIYLADASIAENIAFAINPSNIDHSRVREVARMAQLVDFIETLPSGYRTVVGERGVRLSGGQRQRIGLARALYKQAEVLVLDEATSALDDETEQAVMGAINSLGKEITVLMIAHRLSTLRRCDRIFELKEGILLREGAYSEIVPSAPNSSTAVSSQGS